MKLGRLVEREEYVYEQSMNNRHLFDEASIIQSFIATAYLLKASRR
ncbi:MULTISPECIES: zincin-like metallopeptidase toxin domain-containing protein [Brevibacillus]|nr:MULTISPECIES: zincin-like metallopeptidase toxin domain-containing protein [Brevibacillus]